MMTYELDDIEKQALLGSVLDRARADLNDGKPLTEMRRPAYAEGLADNLPDLQLEETFPDPPRRQLTEEQKELFVDATTLAYMAIRFSGLWKQLSGKEWDDMADELGEKLVDHLTSWIDAELTRRNAADKEMDTWLKSKD